MANVTINEFRVEPGPNGDWRPVVVVPFSWTELPRVDRNDIVSSDDGYDLCYTRHGDMVSFASVQKNDDDQHEAGYCWSSRSGVFNALAKREGLSNILPCMETTVITGGRCSMPFACSFTVESVSKHIDRSVYAIYRKSEYGKYGRLLEESYHILPRNIDPQKTFHLRDEKYSGGEYTITTLYC